MDIIKMTKDLGVEIQKDEAYLKLVAAKEMNDTDEALQTLIGEFNLTRADLDSEISKNENKDTDKINDLNDKIHGMYVDIMNNNNMVVYNQTKKRMDTIMENMVNILSASINGEDPNAVEQNEGCSGSCSGCGGGCH